MLTIDWVLLVILVLAILAGYRLGTIRVVAGVGSLVLGYQVARSYSAPVAEYLTTKLPVFSPSSGAGEALGFISMFIDTTSAANRVLQIVAFVAIFIIVSWILRKIAALLTSIFGHSLLGAINSGVGAVLMLILMGLLLLIFADNILPALVEMGLSNQLLQQFDSSQAVMPLIRYAASIF